MDKLLLWIKDNAHSALMPVAIANSMNFFIMVVKCLSDGRLDDQEISQLFVTASSGVEFIILIVVMAVLKYYSLQDKEKK